MRWMTFLFFLLTPSLCLAAEPSATSMAEPTTQLEEARSSSVQEGKVARSSSVQEGKVARSSSVQEGKKVVVRTRKSKMRAYRFRNDGEKQLLIDSIGDGKKMDKRGMRTAVPEFKVPAIQGVVVRCEITVGGLMCTEELGEARKCPGSVEIRVEGQNAPATAKVDCIGPDANGECDCEFAT